MNYTYQDAAHKHAVTHLNGVLKYSYDAVGNVTSRTEDSTTYTQAYNTENRLQSVTVGGQTTTYSYDADGTLVKKVQGGQTTVYVGQHFEKNLTSGQATSYYALGGQRVAVRKAGILSYLLTDHLGSTSVVTNQSGGIVAQQLYKPWGESRWASGTLPTDRKFTGQRSEEATLGSLYDYGARAYSPRLGRFLSADTIVPSPGDPQSLNRYSYSNNNPVRYIDRNGHCGPLTPVCLALLLGGMALLLQGDSPDLNVTSEDVASQRLGGALFVGGATLAGGSALAGAGGAAQAGTTAATAACADGDCTNEVRGAGQVVQNATKAAESGVIVRQQYETAVRGLSERVAQMRASGKSAEEIARSLHTERRALGEQFKAMTPPDALEQIYARNLEKYGDKLGPTIEWLIERGLKQGKSMGQIWEDIIESASRPGGRDIIPQLLDK